MEIESVQLVHHVRPPTRRQESAQVFRASAELRIIYDAGCIWLEGERGRVGVPLTNVASFTVLKEQPAKPRRPTSETATS